MLRDESQRRELYRSAPSATPVVDLSQATWRQLHNLERPSIRTTAYKRHRLGQNCRKRRWRHTKFRCRLETASLKKFVNSTVTSFQRHQIRLAKQGVVFLSGDKCMSTPRSQMDTASNASNVSSVSNASTHQSLRQRARRTCRNNSTDVRYHEDEWLALNQSPTYPTGISSGSTHSPDMAERPVHGNSEAFTVGRTGLAQREFAINEIQMSFHDSRESCGSDAPLLDRKSDGMPTGRFSSKPFPTVLLSNVKAVLNAPRALISWIFPKSRVTRSIDWEVKRKMQQFPFPAAPSALETTTTCVGTAHTDVWSSLSGEPKSIIVYCLIICTLIGVFNLIPSYLYAITSGALDFGFTVRPLFENEAHADMFLRSACLIGHIPMLSRLLRHVRVPDPYALLICSIALTLGAHFVGMSPTRSWEVLIANPLAYSIAALVTVTAACSVADCSRRIIHRVAPTTRVASIALTFHDVTSHATLLFVLLRSNLLEHAAAARTDVPIIFELFTPVAFISSIILSATAVFLAAMLHRLESITLPGRMYGSQTKLSASFFPKIPHYLDGGRGVTYFTRPHIKDISPTDGTVTWMTTIAYAALSAFVPLLLVTLPRIHVASRSPLHFHDSYRAVALSAFVGRFILPLIVDIVRVATDVTSVGCCASLGFMAVVANVVLRSGILAPKLGAIFLNFFPALSESQFVLLQALASREQHRNREWIHATGVTLGICFGAIVDMAAGEHNVQIIYEAFLAMSVVSWVLITVLWFRGARENSAAARQSVHLARFSQFLSNNAASDRFDFSKERSAATPAKKDEDSESTSVGTSSPSCSLLKEPNSPDDTVEIFEAFLEAAANVPFFAIPDAAAVDCPPNQTFDTKEFQPMNTRSLLRMISLKKP